MNKQTVISELQDILAKDHILIDEELKKSYLYKAWWKGRFFYYTRYDRRSTRSHSLCN